MLIPVWLPVCLLLKFPSSVYSSNILEKTRQADREKSTNASQRRVIRSTTKIFQAALGTILEAAKEVPTETTNYRKFKKPGTQWDANRDYLSLNPVFPGGKKFAFKGSVGDFKIKFLYSDKRMGSRPTILIYDPHTDYKVKVVYDKPRM